MPNGSCWSRCRGFAPRAIACWSCLASLAWATPTLADTQSGNSTPVATETVVLKPGVLLRIAPGTVYHRGPMLSVALKEKDVARQAFAFELIRGQIDFELDPNQHPIVPVVVRGPKKTVAIAKGGLGRLVVSDSQITIAALSGRDMVTAVADKWKSISVGRSVTITTEQPQGFERALPTPPDLTTSGPIALDFGDGSKAVRIEWKPVVGAESYLVQVRRVADGSEAPIVDRQVTESLVELPSLRQGQYTARVASVDATGLQTSFSSPAQFRVVGLRLPSGTTRSENRIYLHQGERLGLVHAEGVEVTYGLNNPLFFDAPESVGLHGDRPVVVRLREKGSTQESQLVLEPLVFTTNIELGPPHAAWPRDTIVARVRFSHLDKQIPANNLSLVPSVTVNTAIVGVKWKTELGQLVAIIPRQPAPLGPWVVRVLISDERGQVLGRRTLEVADQYTDDQRAAGLELR
jgi:hypothetical protein